MKGTISKGITVIMPTYNYQSFIRWALLSLLKQTYTAWELIIINDGSTDETLQVIAGFLADKRIRYYENDRNLGLGACLNLGMERASFDVIAYLPADDYYKKDHLQTLFETLNSDADNILTYSGVKFRGPKSSPTNKLLYSPGQIEGVPLQLVQVMHKKTTDRWMERAELVTDDLYRMYWKKLIGKGVFITTGKITCEWTSHPNQRHKLINQYFGGEICLYREYYKVAEPLRFQYNGGPLIDEFGLYGRFTKRSMREYNGLKILLVGELAYNPERIIAFEEQGHQLYGLWMSRPGFSNVVGPLPFGNVTDIDGDNWLEEIQAIKPDVIYALLNYGSIKMAHQVLMAQTGIPFVWHFKEGTSFAQLYGHWNELIDIYKLSDGQIFINEELREWFSRYVEIDPDSTFILDADLPKGDWFTTDRSPLLSDTDGEIHTVLAGRPMGIMPADVAILAKQKIHIHFYGLYQEVWKKWIEDVNKVAAGYIHIHDNCFPKDWVKEFSKYDAGWLHYFKSDNEGEIMEALWDDLNIPARIATLVAAGLPLIQADNTGHMVATQNLLKRFDIGVLFESFEQLSDQLKNKQEMNRLSENAWKHRLQFSFDYHVPELIIFFNKVIAKKKAREQICISN